MKHQSPILVATSVGMPQALLSASSIDANADTNIVLHTGDEPVFQINIQNYQTEARFTIAADTFESGFQFGDWSDSFAAGIRGRVRILFRRRNKALGGVLSF
jgi:hypothetical protein